MNRTLLVGAAVIVLIISIAAIAVVELPASFFAGSTGDATTSSSRGECSSGGACGSLALGVTDPLVAGKGVTAVYLSYSNEAVREAGVSEGHTTFLNQSGTVELSSLANVSETFATATLRDGGYDSVVIEIATCLVQYEGQNYTASFPREITANTTGGILVSSTARSFALVDISTVVLGTGSTSSPDFDLILSGKAVVPPTSGISTDALTLRGRVALGADPWWLAFTGEQASLKVENVALGNSSLSLTVFNTGATADELSLVVLTGASGITGLGAIPVSILGSAVFEVTPNGTLIQVQVSQLQETSAGYLIGGLSSVTLTYRGTIPAGFASGNDTLAVFGAQASVTTTVSATTGGVSLS